MHPELVYQIALNELPHIGDVVAKNLLSIYGSAKAIFEAPQHQLEKIEGIGTVRAESIKKFNAFASCEKEIVFIEKNGIKPLFLTDDAYPKRLLNCADSPTLLYYKGNADLNADKIVSIVGTRSNTEYGKQATEKLVECLSAVQATIISGLAYGIDAISHKAALKNNLPTVAVVAHGLDMIYPAAHKKLAKDMVEQGGILTEFRNGIIPDKQNFPLRNRIVAGICDALVVIESGKKGGSLITAMLANGYNKDVFALPGRSTDVHSEGCNHYIKTNRAILMEDGNDLLEHMHWLQQDAPKKSRQRPLFIEFSDTEKLIYDYLFDKTSVHVDEISAHTKLSAGSIASALLSLEMQNIVLSQPGKMYSLF